MNSKPETYSTSAGKQSVSEFQLEHRNQRFKVITKIQLTDLNLNNKHQNNTKSDHHYNYIINHWFQIGFRLQHYC